jgi:hypothetical protein
LLELDNLPEFDPIEPGNYYGAFDPEAQGQTWQPGVVHVILSGTPTSGYYGINDGNTIVQWNDTIEDIRISVGLNGTVEGVPEDYVITLAREQSADVWNDLDPGDIDVTPIATIVSEYSEGVNPSWTISIDGTMTAGDYQFDDYHDLPILWNDSLSTIETKINAESLNWSGQQADEYVLSGDAATEYTITYIGDCPRKVDGSDSRRDFSDFTVIGNEVTGATVSGVLNNDGAAKGLWLPVGSTYQRMEHVESPFENFDGQYIYRGLSRPSDNLAFGVRASRVDGSDVDMSSAFDQDGPVAGNINFTGIFRAVGQRSQWEFIGSLRFTAAESGVSEWIRIDLESAVSAMNARLMFGLPSYLEVPNSMSWNKLICEYAIALRPTNEGMAILNHGDLLEVGETQVHINDVLSSGDFVEFNVATNLYDD